MVSLQSEVNELTMTNKLRTTLRRITDNLILHETDIVDSKPPQECQDKVAHPHLSPTVDLNDPMRLYGLAERVVAAESL